MDDYNLQCLLVDIFLIHRLSRSLAFCKFASINFDPWMFIVRIVRDAMAYKWVLVDFGFRGPTDLARTYLA